MKARAITLEHSRRLAMNVSRAARSFEKRGVRINGAVFMDELRLVSPHPKDFDAQFRGPNPKAWSPKHGPA